MRKNLKMIWKVITFISLGLIANVTAATEAGTWFVRPVVGYSYMSDPDADSERIGSADGSADIALDGGFNAGLGIGYYFTPKWAAELVWEYRSNDSEVTTADGERYDDGNYASNLFFLNGIYFFDSMGVWQPYVGAGLSWAEEIDIDLERAGEERSYSTDGDVGYQIFAGINYLFTTNWSLQGELRYGEIADLDLDGEDDNGVIKDIDYETTTVQLGVVYYF